MTREDLQFATEAQLAGFVRDDWEDRIPDKMMDTVLKLLSKIDYPKSVIDLTTTVSSYNYILGRSAIWQTPISIIVKKELLNRIKEYEEILEEIKKPKEPVLV